MATAADHPGWRTSSFTDNGQSCVEVAPGPRAVLVRDTKDGGLGPILLLDHDAWAEFRAAAVARRTGSAGGVVIVREARRTRHRGAEVATAWHVSCGGRTLHYTETEWTAFAAGVRAGEFAFTPARWPAAYWVLPDRVSTAVRAATGRRRLAGGAPVRPVAGEPCRLPECRRRGDGRRR